MANCKCHGRPYTVHSCGCQFCPLYWHSCPRCYGSDPENMIAHGCKCDCHGEPGLAANIHCADCHRGEP